MGGGGRGVRRRAARPTPRTPTSMPAGAGARRPRRLRRGRRGVPPGAGAETERRRLPLRARGRARTARPSCRGGGRLAAAIGLRPDAIKARANLALCLGRQGKHVEAEAAYREALAIRPDHPTLRRGLGVALYWQGPIRRGRDGVPRGRRPQAGLRAGPQRPRRDAGRAEPLQRVRGGLPRGHPRHAGLGGRPHGARRRPHGAATLRRGGGGLPRGDPAQLRRGARASRPVGRPRRARVVPELEAAARSSSSGNPTTPTPMRASDARCSRRGATTKPWRPTGSRSASIPRSRAFATGSRWRYGSCSSSGTRPGRRAGRRGAAAPGRGTRGFSSIARLARRKILTSRRASFWALAVATVPASRPATAKTRLSSFTKPVTAGEMRLWCPRPG